MVDLFVVGQPKSGTTALARHLALHPDICMSSVKEPNWFAPDLVAESDAFHGGASAEFPVRTTEQYEALFDHSGRARFRGEASTAYLFSRDAANEIRRHNPRARIVILLREPVSFMHSLHAQYVADATEDEPDFARALAKEPDRASGRSVPPTARVPSYLLYRRRAAYTEQVARFRRAFPAESVAVFTFEEYAADNAAVYAAVLRLLGADAGFVPTFTRVHDSRGPRSAVLNRVVRRPSARRTVQRVLGPRRYVTATGLVARALLRPQPRAPLSPALETALREECRPEVERLSAYLGRDLVTEWGYGP
jgi:hypothetical protein